MGRPFHQIFTRLLLAFTALAWTSTPAVAPAQSEARADPTKGQIEAARELGRLDDETADLLREALALVQEDFGTAPFRVNQPYQAGAINVYAFDGSRIGEVERELPIFASAKANFVAIRPDVVILDSNFLYVLVHAIQGQLGSEIEISLHSGGGSPFSAGAQRRSHIGNHMLRLANIIELIDGSVPEWQTITRDYRRLSRYRNYAEFEAGELARPTALLNNLGYVLLADYMRRKGLVDNAAPFRSPLVEMTAGALAFIMLHELGHLNLALAPGATPGGAIGSEDFADSFAAQRVASFLARSAPRALTIEAGMRTTAYTFVDSVAAGLLEGFRNFEAQKFGTFIRYAPDGDCTSSERGFFDYNLIDDIQTTMLPLPTRSELDALKNRARQILGSTHQSSIVRAGALIAAASQGRARAGGMEPRVERWRRYRGEVLEALLRQDESALRTAYKSFFREEVGAAAKGVDSAPLLRELRQAGFVEEPTAVCPGAACSLFRHPGTGHIVEIVRGGDGSLVYARMTADEIFPIGRAAQPTDDVRYLQVTLPFRGLDQPLAMDTPDRAAMVRFLGEVTRCGFASFEIFRPRGLFRASTLGNGYEVQVEFIAGRAAA